MLPSVSQWRGYQRHEARSSRRLFVLRSDLTFPSYIWFGLTIEDTQDNYVEMLLLGTHAMRMLTTAIAQHANADRANFPQWLLKACPIARSRTGVISSSITAQNVDTDTNDQGKILFVLLEDLEGHGTRGNVVATSYDLHCVIFKIECTWNNALVASH